MKTRHGVLRIGRLARWQRWTSHVLLAACAATGLVWFALMDIAQWQPPAMVFWWIGHGVTGLLALMVIGMALPTHVVATWRHHRNRWLGSISLAALAVLALSALLLFYGQEGWHAASHWTHVLVGVLAVAAFPLHVVRGRRSVGKNLRSSAAREAA